MEDPVVADDHHSYDRKSIQGWFDMGKRTSPLTRALISNRLTRNQTLRTLIQEWVDNQLAGRGDREKVDLLQAQMFRVKTSEEALSLLRQISEFIESSTFCLLSVGGVDRISGCLQYSNLLTDETSSLIVVLKTQCHSKIRMYQAKYVGLNNQCSKLKSELTVAKTSVSEQEESIESLHTRLCSTQAVLSLREEYVLDIKRTYSQCVTDKNVIQRQLIAVDGMVREEILFSSSQVHITNFDQESVSLRQNHFTDNATKFFLKQIQDKLPPDNCIYMCPHDLYSTYRHGLVNFSLHGKKDTSSTALTMKTQKTKFAYDGIRTWWKGIDLFAKDFVVVPINLHLHWSAVIISSWTIQNFFGL